MGARVWYSFYPGDYGRDTGHLTLLEHGACRLLMDHYYASGAPLPGDETRLMRLCRARTAPEKRAVRDVLAAFFRSSEDGFRHKRIDAEIVKAAEQNTKAFAAGKANAMKRWHADGIAMAMPETLPPQSPPQPPSQESDSLFEEFWSEFPRKEARGAAVIAWGRALERARPETLIAAARAYAAQRVGEDAKFTRMPATWLAQECWLDDAPVAAAALAASAEEAARAWDGAAAPLVAEIGAVSFMAWFAAAEFSRGPPALIRVGKPHLAALIAQRFSGALTRAYGEFSLEA